MINPTDRKPWALPHRLYLKSTINSGEANEENTVSGIVDLDARRLERSATKSALPSYQLGMRLEPSTFQDLLNLKEHSDVESFGELIRFALLEYERAVVEFDGVLRDVHMACVPTANVGDYVIVHAGVAICQVDADEAARTLEELRRLGLLEVEFENDRSRIVDGDLL